MRGKVRLGFFSVLLMFISLAGCLPMSNPTQFLNEENATTSPVKPGSMSTETPTVQVAIRTLVPVDASLNTPSMQVTASTPVPFRSQVQLKVSNEGLTAEVQAIDLDPEFPTVTLCTDLPTAADWMPRFSSIYHGQKIQVPGWMLLDPDNNAANSNKRCYLVTLSTEMFDFGAPSGELIFSLDYFELSIPENMPQTNPKKMFGPWRFTINLNQ